MANKFIAYCRTSTENQREEKTIELQVESISKYADKSNMEVTEWFKDDGVSGGLEDRPELIRLMKYLETNLEIEGVVIYKLDRLARDLYIQEGLIKELTKLNKQVISTLEPDLDSRDPFRKAFRQMLGVFAEFEKAMITLRMKNGRNSAVAKGRWHGGPVYGYDSTGDGQLNINDTEAKVVERIFKMKKRQRLSASRIAKRLNQENIPTKRPNCKWYSFTVRKILKNPLYRGQIRYNGQTYDGQHEPIIK
jgi:site-specific DNA recombinase